ncbi:hypothetical protein QKT49_gp273 [Acanthamoeba castellanii medusavirus]|uniref:Uncharacterized protein n=1 Tax=Acanthamoeba castellanii medusavirus J1 TaxID=3114988 RepID=A0A3T1CXC9_9VIRU|nr:hypothetical protein QKT49_gp273 [Acanthamoeba castellanii medusavirus]BBI30490.1 hypothetical protein [Acanthamoeba castellanii medusavirus J1]
MSSSPCIDLDVFIDAGLLVLIFLTIYYVVLEICRVRTINVIVFQEPCAKDTPGA